jgi:hypothetical protein
MIVLIQETFFPSEIKNVRLNIVKVFIMQMFSMEMCY